MPNRTDLLTLLAPVLEVVKTISPADPEAAAKLFHRLPLESEVLQNVARLLRQGVSEGWLCDRVNGEVRFSRVAKAGEATHGLSIDAVHMHGAGGAHVHPNGEIDLCFAVDGAPSFDGHAPGWTVYPPGSWHVPSVAGGSMDILYFLPGGAIEFTPEPPQR